MTEKSRVRVKVNGKTYETLLEPRKLLVDFLRDDLSLTGTHIGCEHGVCGACAVLLDGEEIRSCLMFAVQADNSEVTTVEGLSENGNLNVLQNAFRKHHAVQCGFCTSGMLIASYQLLRGKQALTEDEIRKELAGNLCRCTGYQNIIKAVQAALNELSAR